MTRDVSQRNFLSVIAKIEGDPQRIFSETKSLTENCLNVWSPEVTSTLQLLASDQSVIEEYHF